MTSSFNGSPELARPIQMHKHKQPAECRLLRIDDKKIGVFFSILEFINMLPCYFVVCGAL